MPISAARLFLTISPIVAAAHVGWYYAELPGRMASHFGPGGDANGWMSRSAFVGGYVGLIAAMAILYNGLTWVLPRLPASMINLPRRDYWLAPERRQRTLEDLGRQLARIGVAMVLFLMVVFHLCLRANLDGTFRLNPAVMILPLATFLATLALWLGQLVWRYARPAAHSAG